MFFFIFSEISYSLFLVYDENYEEQLCGFTNPLMKLKPLSILKLLEIWKPYEELH